MSDTQLLTITDLLDGAHKVYVSGPDHIYVEKAESFERTNAHLEDIEALVQTAAQKAGRKIDKHASAAHFRIEGGITVAVFRQQGASSPLVCFEK